MPKAQTNRRVGSRATRGQRTGGRSARVVSDVLAATLELFAEQGYSGLSIEAVALRARVNKTTVYRRWPTKADLVGAALISLRDEDPEPPDTGDLREDLCIILRRWAEQMMTPRRRAIMQSVLLGPPDMDVQAILQRMRAQRPAIPTVVFERAMARRELPKGCDTALIAAALIGPLHSRAFLKREPADDAFIRKLVNLIVAGARAGGAR